MMIRKYVYIIFTSFLLVGCEFSSCFSVSGVITDAEGETLYLEHIGLTKTTKLDSCLLDKDGVFSFKETAPQYPDFYRLRINHQSLLLAVDSVEKITIKTTRDSLSSTCYIDGSLSSLNIARIRALSRVGTRDELRIETQRVIMQDPRSLIAYYALFLKQNGEYIWNINDPVDRCMYQVVATSFHTWMPDNERTKVLYSQVMEVLQTERLLENQQAVKQLIEESENAFLDIVLPDEQGDMQSLSSLRGEVIILDFSSSEMEQSIAYTFELRELYNKYNNQGLEIYSVSLERNQLFWEQTVENLPWTTVRLDSHTAASVLMRYNIQVLPTLFLIDRQGVVQGRYVDFKALDTDIQKYL